MAGSSCCNFKSNCKKISIKIWNKIFVNHFLKRIACEKFSLVINYYKYHNFLSFANFAMDTFGRTWFMLSYDPIWRLQWFFPPREELIMVDWFSINLYQSGNAYKHNFMAHCLSAQWPLQSQNSHMMYSVSFLCDMDAQMKLKLDYVSYGRHAGKGTWNIQTFVVINTSKLPIRLISSNVEYLPSRQTAIFQPSQK